MATVEVLVAPDNAQSRLRELIGSAEREILVQQMSVGRRSNPLLEAALRAARRGVRVKILQSSEWYVRDENRDLVRCLETKASREDLPVEAKLAKPRDRFEKIHAKGIVLDGHTVVLGSLNWNVESAERNREVVLVVHSQGAAQYFGEVIRSDWRGGAHRVPGVYALGAVICSVAALFLMVRWVEIDSVSEGVGFQ